MEFAGEFETHITIRLDGDRDAARLRDWAARRGLKFTHIILARGESASQPMVTREGRGTLSNQLEVAEDLAAELRADGLAVTRIKIEASPWNEDVPQTQVDGSSQPNERYFENHVKLLLSANSDLGALVELARHHAAHVSRNALRTRDDGRQERFVTQRFYQVGRTESHRKLDAMIAGLRLAGYEIMEVEEEFVVHDDHLALDDGWLEMSTNQRGQT